jgi:hypothetical protein
MDQSNKLLIIGSVWPEPNSSAAGPGMLISLFKENGFVVTFASPAMDSDFMVDLELEGSNKNNYFKLFEF